MQSRADWDLLAINIEKTRLEDIEEKIRAEKIRAEENKSGRKKKHSKNKHASTTPFACASRFKQ